MLGKCWLPNNSEFELTENNELIITAPSDWKYVGFSNGEIVLSNSSKSKISCTCTGSGSCIPFIASGPLGSTSGCAGSCSSCNMKQSINEIFIDSGGYINLGIEPSIVMKDEFLPAAFDAMFEIPEVQEKVNTFIKNTFQDIPFPEIIDKGDLFELPQGYLFAIVNICGHASAIPIPENIMTENMATGTSTSCSCTKGSCTLKKKSVLIGSATYCEGTCTGTCTLSTSLIQNNLEVFTYSAVLFNF
ncbi:MAG: hypothetical protein M9933_18745 [Chitinophagaceae bacterium]|nr:hypothetical protein [Chitinophagaceae bacterium]